LPERINAARLAAAGVSRIATTCHVFEWIVDALDAERSRSAASISCKAMNQDSQSRPLHLDVRRRVLPSFGPKLTKLFPLDLGVPVGLSRYLECAFHSINNLKI